MSVPKSRLLDLLKVPPPPPAQSTSPTEPPPLPPLGPNNPLLTNLQPNRHPHWQLRPAPTAQRPQHRRLLPPAHSHLQGPSESV